MRLIVPAVVVVLLFLFVLMNSTNPTDMPGNEYALNWTQRAVGGIVAATAAIGMLLFAAANQSANRSLALVLPLLGGMLLVAPHWSIALAIGLVGAAMVAKSIFDGRAIPPR